MLPWLSVQKVESPSNLLTLREAGQLFGRSHSALAQDCKYLKIDVSRVNCSSGCIDRHDAWILYAFLCWKLWKSSCNPCWRGDRKDYAIDCPTDETKLGYVDLVGGSRDDLESRFEQALVEKRKRLLGE